MFKQCNDNSLTEAVQLQTGAVLLYIFPSSCSQSLFQVYSSLECILVVSGLRYSVAPVLGAVSLASPQVQPGRSHFQFHGVLLE